MRVENSVDPVKLAYMHRSRKFCQSGSSFDNVFFFLVYERREDPNATTQ